MLATCHPQKDVPVVIYRIHSRSLSSLFFLEKNAQWLTAGNSGVEVIWANDHVPSKSMKGESKTLLYSKRIILRLDLVKLKEGEWLVKPLMKVWLGSVEEEKGTKLTRVRTLNPVWRVNSNSEAQAHPNISLNIHLFIHPMTIWFTFYMLGDVHHTEVIRIG